MRHHGCQGNKTPSTLAKFGLDPDEWHAVQRLRRAGDIEGANALEAAFAEGKDTTAITPWLEPVEDVKRIMPGREQPTGGDDERS